ncbi:MAG: polysulfide reductase NrfD [Calditrichae bacterium]|nr:polysulfide reductase NrfD [Calditrichota bacterium]MCB9059329.1 polysulfide reductase NrfD [Calditrichia bacterium]
MNEVNITSGRMNHGIDPVLHAWGWEIPLYLFLGGLVAGILFFSALFFLRKKESDFKTTVKIAPLWVPPMLAIGLGALFLDLTHKLYFWKLYTTIRWESPMSWGAWTLMVIFPVSLLWAATWIKDVFPGWDWKISFVEKSVELLKNYRTWMAWSLILLAVILGMYTGILLSAFNARPFWNTSILGPLFLVSGLSTGAAFIILTSKSAEERKRFSQIDMILIGVEIFLIIHLFMGFLASTSVHIQAAEMFLGGPYTAIFWTFVVGMGLVVPLLVELFELKGIHVPAKLAAILVLTGGLILRFIVVDAGQASRWLYKFMQ